MSDDHRAQVLYAMRDAATPHPTTQHSVVRPLLSFEVNQHDAARRLWMIALDIARAADHPLGTDQTVFVLYDMAL